MTDPTEIKDVACSCCGAFIPEDELYETDHDWGVCYECGIELEKL
tara:strand:+ start:78 stop:212 length:135 start_codon:yes stop_codon:yes gene_type:complete